MTRRSLQDAREAARQRELFFAHIAAQAAAQRSATVRRHAIMFGLAIALLVGVSILLRP